MAATAARGPSLACRGGLLVAAAIVAAGCGGSRPEKLRLPAGAPIVLVSIDTLRADHLPVYGYGGVATPALTALAGDGVVFDHAYAHTPLTLPSHASILSGLLPADHGLRDNVGYRFDTAAIERGDFPFLPAQLQRLGYATCGAVSAFVLDHKTGIAAGFDRYDDKIEFRTGRGLGGIQRPGRETLDAALACLRDLAGKPLFLFLHLYEPHTPYKPPEPFASRYANKYDGEIAAADALVGELVVELRRRGLYDRALMIVTSDHGEGLGDHGEAEHGVLLNVESIHVPLLVKLPARGHAGTRVDAPAELIDIAPTVLGLLGEPVSPRQRGTSLLTLLEPAAPRRRVYSETFYPRLHFGWSDLASLIDGKAQLIAGPSPELYDLVTDPDEKKNVLVEQRRLYAELERELTSYDRSLVPPSAVDDETRQAMAALGYLGAVAATAGALPDPKSRLGVLADLQAGFHHHARKDYPEAIAALRKVLANSPQMTDAWEFLGDSLAKLGQRYEAVAAYREALKTSGGAGYIAAQLAALYYDLGELDEAEAHVKLVVGWNPARAHGLMARILLARKKFAEAEREARAALGAANEPIGPQIVLAEVFEQTARMEEALAACREARRLYAARKSPDPDLIAGLGLLEGKILADLGNVAAAEAAFKGEIELFPENPPAWSHLALLYALADRGREVGPTLRGMVAANGGAAGVAEAIRTLRALGNDTEASRLLRDARQRYPSDRELLALR